MLWKLLPLNSLCRGTLLAKPSCTWLVSVPLCLTDTFRSSSVYIDFVTARAGNACRNPANYSSRITLAFALDKLTSLHNNPGITRHGQIERPFNFADFNTQL